VQRLLCAFKKKPMKGENKRINLPKKNNSPRQEKQQKCVTEGRKATIVIKSVW